MTPRYGCGDGGERETQDDAARAGDCPPGCACPAAYGRAMPLARTMMSAQPSTPKRPQSSSRS